MGDVKVRIAVDNSGLKSGLRQAKEGVESFARSASAKLESFGKSVIAAFSVGAIVGFAKQVAAFAGDLQDTADRLNLSAESVQTLGDYFGESGVNARTFERSITGLNSKIADALTGNPAAEASFEALGVSLRDLQKAESSQDVLYKIADSMKAAGHNAAHNAALIDIFGKAAATKLAPALRQGSESMKEFQATVSKFSNEEIGRIDAAWDELMRNMKSAAIDTAHFIVKQFSSFKSVFSGGSTEGQAGQAFMNMGGLGTAGAIKNAGGKPDPGAVNNEPDWDAMFPDPNRPDSAAVTKWKAQQKEKRDAKEKADRDMEQLDENLAETRKELAEVESEIVKDIYQRTTDVLKDDQEQRTRDVEEESKKRIAQYQREQAAMQQRVQNFLMSPQERREQFMQQRREERAKRTLKAQDKQRQRDQDANDNGVDRPNVFKGVDPRARSNPKEKFGPPADASPKKGEADPMKGIETDVRTLTGKVSTLIDKINVA